MRKARGWLKWPRRRVRVPMPVPVSQIPTLTSTLVPKEESNMPFIDDELFWYSDNDGKMDLSQCLQQSNTGQSVEFPMELSALVGTPTASNVPTEEGAEKLAAPSTQGSPTSIPYASRAEIKTENIQPETNKGLKLITLDRHIFTDNE
ncbi:Uncharacterized protein DBV15_00140 [Temnothorax longispinosus]|uniref:Uncharacterized protein n=1 Tax=Temnothorax longispinosus TaxID=300112 RepID=A0A4S2KDE3_9HYME|nr:Uncharacterized protein DBV15_00140 [Temnothorax longispinosus]